MASSGTLSGIAVASAGAGVLLVYAGLKNKSVLGEIQSVIRGKGPAAAGPGAGAITQVTQTGASSAAAALGNKVAAAGAYSAVGTSSPQQALNNAAAAYGWNSGAQWQALQSLEMAEAAFNPNATNPTSGAYGLAQALGHGQGAATQGTVTNEYGGFGVSDSVAQAANSGDAGAQAIWMCAYIKVVYGDPVAAWAQYYNHPGGVGYY